MENKGLAIIAVVAIHAFSSTIGNSPVNLFVDQLSRFTVPLFVALSGYGLSKSLEKALCHPELVSGSKNQMPKQVRHDIGVVINYYAKRVLKLLPWFLFASVLILIYKGGYDFLNYHTWTMILRGQADYHLYFVPMIFRLYLIFPLLYYLVTKRPRLMLILALVLQVVWYEYSRDWLDQMQYLRLESWIFYFVLGIYLSFRPMIHASKYMLLFGLILTFGHAYLLQQSGVDMLIATRFTRLPVILYATGVILFFYNRQLASPAGGLTILGKYSYQIYLLHTLTLRFLPQTNPFLLTFLVLLFTLIPVYVLSRTLAICLRRP